MSDKRISISIDEYNMLHTEILSQKATIINLTAENNLLANDRDGYVQLLTDQNASLTAEVEGLKRQIAEWVDAGGEAHSVIQRQMEDRAKLRAALLVARKYVLVQSCELSLMPEDAARDLDVIDEALEEDDDQA
jgi:hypothetical protein